MKNCLIKISDTIKKNIKLIIFCLIFVLICVLYNQNSQTLNFFLKRGVVLEYSIDADLKADNVKIKKYLSSLGIEYSIVDEINEFKYPNFDKDGALVEKSLFIGLPYKAQENKINLFNSVSDYVFENYPSSKLISIKTLNDNYHKPNTALCIFFPILAVSLILWLFVLLIFFNPKKLFCDFSSFMKDFLKSKIDWLKKLKEPILKIPSKIGEFVKTLFSPKEIIKCIKNFLKTIKNDIISSFKMIKEKGMFYFLKDFFFGDESEKDVFSDILSTVIFVVVCVIITRYFIGELRWIPSGSMHPVIYEHDRVFVEKLDYPKREIKRGDILVFYPPSTELKNSPLEVFKRLSGIFCKDIAYIKRVVGMPKDKFEIKYLDDIGEYRVFINDIALDEPYISSKNEWTPCSDTMFCGPFVIPENNYFMMGDNRNNSQDSRFWGFLDEKRVIGRANFMFYPFSRINILKDKYIRLHEQKIKNTPKDRDYIIDRYEFLYNI